MEARGWPEHNSATRGHRHVRWKAFLLMDKLTAYLDSPQGMTALVAETGHLPIALHDTNMKLQVLYSPSRVSDLSLHAGVPNLAWLRRSRRT